MVNMRMRYADIRFQPTTTIPPALAPLARAIQGKTYETAKRIIVSKTGSVRPHERFDDSLADAVFLRLQRVAQVGVYSSEAVVKALGRGAERLSGDGLITLYRSAPPGVGIRPGDFCTDDRHEAGFYKHGGNRIQMRKVPRADVIR